MNLFQVKSKKSSNETMEIKTNTPLTVVSSCHRGCVKSIGYYNLGNELLKRQARPTFRYMAINIRLVGTGFFSLPSQQSTKLNIA